ncbi:hypothetical protein ACJ41O_012665 [Fusarium nematophilum]
MLGSSLHAFNAMSPPTPPRTYFITLPCELRHQIYQDYFRLDGGYVHNSNDPFNGKLTSPNGQPIHLSLMYVSKSIAVETKDMPLRLNTVS